MSSSSSKSYPSYYPKYPTAPPVDSFGQPKRVPTDSSYYEIPGPERTWMYARDVREQVSSASHKRPYGEGYPSHFGNKENYPLQAKKPWVHHPLMYTGHYGTGHGGKPGPVRAFYNDRDRATFDVGAHDEKAGFTPNGTPKYSFATYYPKK